MKQEVADKFVAALRSGKYIQTFGVLVRTDENKTPYKFCVMGVLCDLAREEGVVGGWDETTLWHMTSPNEVLQWAEIDETLESNLIELNDDYELSFEDFAELIEGRYDNIALQSAVFEKRAYLDAVRDADEEWYEDSFEEEEFVDAPRPE